MTKAADKQLDYLRAHSVKTDWREKAEWRRSNSRWLHYSQYIAVKAYGKMKELGLTQAQLAAQMGCSQQYVSKLLKGSENLTLETIAKLEEILDLEIFPAPQPLVTGYSIAQPKYQMVADPGFEEE